MIIQAANNAATQSNMLLHFIPLSIQFPKLGADDIGKKTIKDVLERDAKLLASRIKKHLESRQSVKSVTISSTLASVTFTAITAESIFGKIQGNQPEDRISVKYNVSPVDINTGDEGKLSVYTVSELGWDNKTCSVETTFGSNYYKAAYLLAISEGMQQKNPGGYYTLLKNFEDIGSLPYISAPLSEQVIGHISDFGFIFGNLYPIPGSVMTEVIVADNPYLSAIYSQDRTESLISDLILSSEKVDLSAVVNQLNDSELGHLSSGIDILYAINLSSSIIDISERLSGHLLNQRQNLVWCFSELSRFFELANIVNNSNINKNLRLFQNKLMSVADNDMNSALFPDSAPRDLEDFVMQLFPSAWKPMYKVIKQMDPNRILFNIVRVSGDESTFNRFKGSMKYLSHGLRLAIPYLKEAIKANEVGGEIHYSYRSGSDNPITFKLVPLSDHSADKMAYSEISSIENLEVYGDLIALINVVFWLNVEESEGFLLNKDTPGKVKLVTMTHLARKYSNLPIFNGYLKAKVIKGLL